MRRRFNPFSKFPTHEHVIPNGQVRSYCFDSGRIVMNIK
jgi:hypothetical protein